MKNIFFGITIFLAQLCFGQDFNGVWSDSSSTSFTNCYAVFVVQNDSVHMTHYLEFNNQPFLEYGTGIVLGDTLVYDVRVAQQVPGWKSKTGKHVLILSADKKTLSGTYTDNLGNTGALIFKKRFPKK